MATVTHLDHRGPLRVHGRVLRRGRNAVVAGLEVVDEGRDDRLVAAATGTFAVLDPGRHEPRLRPAGRHAHAAPVDPDAPSPEEFFRIEPGTGPMTRLELADHLRNPWGILHGGAVAVLVDVAACRAGAVAGRRRSTAVRRPGPVWPPPTPCCTISGRSGSGRSRPGARCSGARRARPGPGGRPRPRCRRPAGRPGLGGRPRAV